MPAGGERVGLAVVGGGAGGAGPAGEPGGLVGVVEIEDVRELGAAEFAEQSRPLGEAAREGQDLRDIGVERGDGRIGGFGQERDAGPGPVQEQIAQHAAKEHEVPEIPAADDENVRSSGH